MPNTLFNKNLNNILQLDSQRRQSQGRMHFASADASDHAGSVFQNIAGKASEIILTTGCGLPNSVDNLPVRFPSLIVPGLNMLRACVNSFGQTFPITYQVYQAGNFIKKINNIPAEKMDGTVAFMQTYLQEFTERFFPDVASKVSFDFRKDVETEDLEPITSFLKSTKDEHAIKHLESIHGYASRDKGRTDPYTYTSANIHFNCLGDLGTSPDGMIIPVGGQKEIPFFYLTSLYHKEMRKEKNHLFPVSFNAQQIPSYYPCRKGDLTIGNMSEVNLDDILMSVKDLPHMAVQDFENLLEPVGATVPVLIEMASSIKKQNFIYA